MARAASDLFDECRHKENGRPRSEPGMTGRRVNIGLGKRRRGVVLDGGRGAGAGRRGADIAVNRGGGETNDMVIEEERQGVGESSAG